MKKINILFALLLVLLGYNCFSAENSFEIQKSAIAKYYGDDLDEFVHPMLDSSELKRLIEKFEKKNRKVLGYTTAKKYLFGKLFLKKEGKDYIVPDLYCHKDLHSKNGAKVGPMIIPPNGLINCEHTWPQSRFNPTLSKSMQKSDLHHLFPTDSKANGIRGNYPFAEVRGKVAYKSCEASTIGKPLDPAPDMTQRARFFQPPKSHRGNIARALFYFSVLYHLPIDEPEESYLRRWNREDPVDQDEVRINNMIMDIQGNRNPFVDFPTLSEHIEDF